MSILNEPKNYELLNTCNKCGFCQANCSVYKEVLNEAFSTRGRLRLIKAVADGLLERTPYYEKIINSCLMCEECSKTCPSGVPGHQLIQMAREDLAKEKGLSFIKKFPLTNILPNNNLRKLSFASLRIIKNMAHPLGSLKHYKGINIESLPIAKKDFLTSFCPIDKASSEKNLKVGFFVGCMINHTLPDVAQSVVRILEKYGCQVVVPKEQRCCGTPSHTYGHSPSFQEVAVTNMNLFKETNVDAIITACASCGNMLKKYGRIFADHDEYRQLSWDFSRKVRDISEFLVDDLSISLENVQSPLTGKITYHDPCHLVRGQNISHQPRQILQQLQGHEYIEMPGASKCCGAAGMFQGFYPEEATAISNKKVANIVTTEANYVITNCPACFHRIQGSLHLSNKPQQVIHLAQLLDPEFSL